LVIMAVQCFIDWLCYVGVYVTVVTVFSILCSLSSFFFVLSYLFGCYHFLMNKDICIYKVTVFVVLRRESDQARFRKYLNSALFDANDDFYRYLLRLTRKFYGFITTENHHFGRESKNERMTICRQIAFQESWLADNDRQKNLTHFRYIRSKFWQKIKWN